MTITADLPRQDLPPSLLGFGKVVGRVIIVVGDTTADADDKPEARAAQGKVKFTPRNVASKVTDDGTGRGAYVSWNPVECTLDTAGFVIDDQGRQGVWLVAGQYTVTWTPASGQSWAIGSFDITVSTAHTAGSPFDLATGSPTVPPQGVSIVSYVLENAGETGQVLTKTAGGAQWTAPTRPLDFPITDFPALAGEVTDDGRIQRATNAALLANGKAGAVVRFPGGVFTLAQAVTGTVGGQQRIGFAAAAGDSTLLRVLPGNTVGGIVMDTGFATDGSGKRNPTRNSQVAFSGLSVARVIGSANESNGTGIGLGFISGVAPNTSVSNGGQSNPHLYTAVFDRCRVWGEDTDKGTFQYAFAAPGAFMPRFFGCVVGGPFTNTGAGQPDSHPSYVGKAGILLHNAYSPVISHCQIWCYEYGILDEGYIAEAGTVVMCNIVGCKIGIKHTRAANEPTFVISDTHINARKHALWIDGIRLLQLHDCLFYNNDSTSVDPTPWDLFIQSADIVDIHDCIHFQPAGATNRIHVKLDKTNTDVGNTQIPDKDGNLYTPNSVLSNVKLHDNFYSSGGLWAVHATGVTNLDVFNNKVTEAYTGSASGPYSLNGTVYPQPAATGIRVA